MTHKRAEGQPDFVRVPRVPNITLRDYFAAMALMGFSARELPNHSHELVAQLSYDAADAMISERDK